MVRLLGLECDGHRDAVWVRVRVRVRVRVMVRVRDRVLLTF